jgi:hypothetical protein
LSYSMSFRAFVGSFKVKLFNDWLMQ